MPLLPPVLIRPFLVGLFLVLLGCPSPYEWRHENQWDSRTQISAAHTSQVKLRSAQSRIFDSTDRRRIVEAIISTMQDLNLMVEVADEDLGVVSGRLFLPLEHPLAGDRYEPSYHLYDGGSLLILSKGFRTWGPFWQRSNIVRLTVTVRRRNEKQSVVRASAQFYLQEVEDPLIYQQFFRTLEQAVFLQGHLVEESMPVQEPQAVPGSM
ncbi:hypothetical protein LPW11_03055 [Geomonas sp. RF6]|uniref:hypothetical protein n=1 Tax=Geomonas sp. RF6 TaxID=2897342 RepID=UPI001E597412|nr:hypothetical protein [Geomonas sp. RF6]UFS71178.1 hypothetical protein LPW11_03055 [Geomonas sp. RF6]